MKWSTLLALPLAAEAITPIAKVIELLNEMHEKGTKAKNEEEVRMSSFNQWCTTVSKQKARDIEAGKSEKAELEATIGAAEAEAASLTDEIEKHAADQAASEAKIEKEKAEREEAAANFKETKADYDAAIDSIKRAVQVLKSQNFDREQAESLIQVASHKFTPTAARMKLAAFLQSAEPGVANAYEFQSGGVIDMLKDLGEKFKGELSDIIKKETEDKHAFEMLFQNESDLINNAKAAISDKKGYLGEQQQIKADASEALVDCTKALTDDTAYLQDMDNMCKTKNEQFNAAQELRASELAQIEEAVRVLESDDVSGAGARNLPSLSQTSVSFMQIKSRINSDNYSSAQAKVAAFLQGRAEASKSEMLAQMATAVSEDPFAKVKKMIFNMINKLKEEAVKEAEEHGWCQGELGANKIERESKESDVEKLTALIEEKNAKIAQETQDIADLTKAISEMDETLATATENRNKEKADNEAAIADAKAGSAAIGAAIAKLKEFYAGAAEGTSFVQIKQSPAAMDAPETFDTEYKGMQEMNGGVVGFLEVIQSDFVRLEAETTADEAASAEEYQKLKNDTEVDRAVKNAEIDHKSEKKASLQSDVQVAESDLASTKEGLEAANKYYESLRKKCIDTGVTHEERMAKRAEEIQSLKEALDILQQ